MNVFDQLKPGVDLLKKFFLGEEGSDIKESQHDEKKDDSNKDLPSLTTSKTMTAAQKEFSIKLEQEKLAFDPMYGFVRLGIAYLTHKKAVLAEKSQGRKAIIKVTISDGKIFIKEDGYAQAFLRFIWRSSRSELLQFQRTIIKGLKWFPPGRQNDLKTIYTFAIRGLDALHKTYGPAENGKEQDFTGRGIQWDSSLIKRALEGNISSELDKAEKELFPLKDQVFVDRLTRDQFYKREIHANWNDTQYQLIAKSLTEAERLLDSLDKVTNIETIQSRFERFDAELSSLRNRVKHYPDKFIDLQKRIEGINAKLLEELGKKDKADLD